MTAKYTFHLIPNAHLDPVWLWDWREGLNEGLNTCRTILDLMDRNRNLTFIRGESAIYQHIERTDPDTFKRIARYVKQGRWDIVGGTVIQPDTNLPTTEVFARHLLYGKRYFREKFGVDVKVAWAADSFGHAEGLPEILAAAGMTGFAFSRPNEQILPLEKPAFWWQGPGGSRVMAYRMVGWYGSERTELPSRLDAALAHAEKSDLHNVGVFFGLGNHGGGPTARQIQDIANWSKDHPEIKVEYSGLHRLFAALSEEFGNGRELPRHKGEMNFVLRGCYSSLAKFKNLYRRAEAAVARAERTDSVIAAATKSAPRDLHDAWNSILFNSFHDILPGSSIERAFDDQIAWVGGTIHDAQKTELRALDLLWQQVDTRVATPQSPDMPAGAAMLVWNPHPRAYEGLIELEASLDWRPIWKYHKNVDALPLKVTGPDGKPLAFQQIATEHSSMVELAWRKRVVTPVKIPAFGWNVIEMAWVEGFTPDPIESPITATDNTISNGVYEVTARRGEKAIAISRDEKPLFTSGGLSAITVEDPWGSWGGMAEEKDSIDLSTIRTEWKITSTALLERGPLRASLWVRMQGGRSTLDLTFSVSKDRDTVDVSARLLWDERSARLKLVMPGVGTSAEFDVPGARVQRSVPGELPGGRWVRAYGDDNRSIGFVSDAIYNFDLKDGNLRATIARASRYANDVKTAPEEELWRPAVDRGELKFHFTLTPADADLNTLAEQLEQSPIALLVPAKKGKWKKSGSLASLEPANLKVLALKPAEDAKGWILRVQEMANRDTTPVFLWAGKRIKLSQVRASRIVTWRLTSSKGKWAAREIDITEAPTTRSRNNVPPSNVKRTAKQRVKSRAQRRAAGVA